MACHVALVGRQFNVGDVDAGLAHVAHVAGAERDVEQLVGGRLHVEDLGVPELGVVARDVERADRLAQRHHRMAVVDLCPRPGVGADRRLARFRIGHGLGQDLVLAVGHQGLEAQLLECLGDAAIVVVPAAVPVGIARQPFLQRLQTVEAGRRARRRHRRHDRLHEAGIGGRPLERLEAAHRRADHRDQAFEAERIDQEFLRRHDVAHGDVGEGRPIGLAGARIGAVGSGAAMRRAERIHRDHKGTIRIDRLARTDQPVEPAGRALGHAAALLAGGVAAGGVMARRVAVHDQDRVVARRRQAAVSLVSEFQDGQGLPAFQAKITRCEEFALDSGQLRHGNTPFHRVAILPPTGYLALQDRRRPAARPSGKGIAERDGDGARVDGI